MKTEPQTEHQWLQKLVGEWAYETEMMMEPGGSPQKCRGIESVLSIQGLWVIAESQGEMPCGGHATAMVTLGFDPQTQRFVGTFIASMMTHLWIYNGTLDATGKVLTLDTEGPDFSGGPNLVKYQDIIEFVSNDHRVLKSQLMGPDGNWNQFMTAHYRRRK